MNLRHPWALILFGRVLAPSRSPSVHHPPHAFHTALPFSCAFIAMLDTLLLTSTNFLTRYLASPFASSRPLVHAGVGLVGGRRRRVRPVQVPAPTVAADPGLSSLHISLRFSNLNDAVLAVTTPQVSKYGVRSTTRMSLPSCHPSSASYFSRPLVVIFISFEHSFLKPNLAVVWSRKQLSPPFSPLHVRSR